MEIDTSVFYIAELIGVIAFAASGAIIATNRHLDIFGVVVLGVTSALGGGVIRDIVIGIVPPRMFNSYKYVLLAFITSVLVFFIILITKSSKKRYKNIINIIMNIFDAIGLGIFTITGIQATINVGFGGNFFLAICLGVITGIGGGILRDIMSREIPLVLHKQVYALASICGGTFYYFLYQQMNIDYTYAALLGIGIVVTIRLFAAYFRWDLPKAVPDEIKV